MTLGDAIAALRADEAGRNDMTEVMARAVEVAFERHDAVHILFGCGTTLADEIAAHAWMLLGTTARIREMHGAVANQEHRAVLHGIGRWKLSGVWLRSLPRLVRIAVNAARMRRRVAFEEMETLKGCRVDAIRASHGIRMV